MDRFAAAYGWTRDHILFEVPWDELQELERHIKHRQHEELSIQSVLHGGEPLPPEPDYTTEAAPGVSNEQHARELSGWHRMKLLRQKRQAAGLAD